MIDNCSELSSTLEELKLKYQMVPLSLSQIHDPAIPLRKPVELFQIPLKLPYLGAEFLLKQTKINSCKKKKIEIWWINNKISTDNVLFISLLLRVVVKIREAAVWRTALGSHANLC